MPLRDPSLVEQDHPRLESLGPRLFKVSAAVGVAGLGLGLLLAGVTGVGLRRFLHAYLVSYAYVLSISLGALFFVALQHLSRASWSVVVRRVAEILAANTSLLAVLFLPILAGLPELYEWSRGAEAGADGLLEHKRAYLNVPFFAIRWAVYFAVWIWLGRVYLRRSREQDASGDPGLTLRMERLSAPALILYGLSVTFAAIDLLMSLDARWYSTIYGVYYFSGGAVGFLALLTLVAVILQSRGRLARTITIEHYHDLGKHLFAFVFFWAYIAFSQYLLIWYANIPEETEWYAVRRGGPWGGVALALLAGHFVFPFLGLLPRAAKRRRSSLAFWAAWLLVMHWIDVYWLVMPEASPDGTPFHPVDLACLVGLGGLFAAGAVRIAGNRPLVPMKDPRLADSLTFENA